jgi:diguanylate cyclase (GGDEF)-like protein/PAS domain S-box-containing protein
MAHDPTVEHVSRACEAVRAALGAEDAYVIRAGDPAFIRMACECDPTTYEIKQRGYWIIWRQLATTPELSAAVFNVRDRLVGDGASLAASRATTHFATILPGDESNSELLIVRGPWPEGLTDEQIEYIDIARALVAHLVSSVVDSERRTRQRQQLESLANISSAFGRAQDPDEVTTSVATAMANASGFDWVLLVVYNDACDAITTRALNLARHSDTRIAAQMRSQSASDSAIDLRLGVELGRRNAHILLRDVFAPDLADTVPHAELMREGIPSLQEYFKRAHVLSMALFPVVFQGKALGYASFSSSTARSFDDAEVRFLQALVTQAATALHGLRLYQHLEESRGELRLSEERFRSLVQNASDLVTIIDADGVLRYASPSIERIMGYTIEDWIGTNILAFIHPDDVARATVSLTEVAGVPGVHEAGQFRVRHSDGSYRHFETTATNLLDVPSVQGIVHNSHDISERVLAEDALRQSEERFRSLVQNASDLITVIDADTTIRYQSPSIEHVLGHDAASMLGKRLTDLIHIDDVARTLSVLHNAMRDPGARTSADMRVRDRNGGWRHVEFIGTDQRHDPAIGGLVLNIRDVTDRKALEQQLRHQATHDPLTKLANRTRFSDRLQAALARAERLGHRIGILFMDLDNFKGVNDSLGHSAGDRLLTGVAERIERCLRPGDTVARLGGDEFAILLDAVSSADDATRVVDRIFRALEEPFTLEGKEISVRASVGIAVSGLPDTTPDADALLRDADVAMYVAKSHGKGCYEVFETSMQVSMMERLELLADLQRAVERSEFVLQYQPMVALRTGELSGVEALVRWQHPRRGLIQPGDFISLAEDSGSIIGLGRWVLENACRQATAWQMRFPQATNWTLSVNVSAKQLQHPGFVGEVAHILKATGLRPDRLILEITESVMMHDAKLMMTRLQDLKNLGLRLAIDDFGTGYSSLSYLRQFPFDLLKIDKSFIDDVGSTDQQKELTRAIIELGRTLDLELVAEGIERTEQLARLLSLECNLGQGFFFARPLDREEVEELLSGIGPAATEAA